MKLKISNGTEGRDGRSGRSLLRRAAALLLIGLAPPGISLAQNRDTSHPAPPPHQEHAKPSAGRPLRNQPSDANNRNAQPGNRNGETGGLPAEGFRGAPDMGRPGLYGANNRPGQEHLPQWFSQHQHLSPSQQEQALRREPGFNRLAPEQQQRLLNRLRTLDSRPPQVRQRMLARNEAFQRLSPEGRQEVRAAAQSLGQMPSDRQRMVRHAFHELRQIPPGQREAILNSARFLHEYSPQERHILSNLLSIEPYQSQ